MNFFKNITLLLFFGMITSPMHSMDFSFRKKLITSLEFSSQLVLCEKKLQDITKAANAAALVKQINDQRLQELNEKIDEFKSVDKDHYKTQQVLKTPQFFEYVTLYAEKERIEFFAKSTPTSPNSVASYTRNVEQKYLKGILKKSK